MIDLTTEPNIPAVWELTAAIIAENQKSLIKRSADNGQTGDKKATGRASA